MQTVSDCFDHGRHRQRRPQLPLAGPVMHDHENAWARFSARVSDDYLVDVRFRCTTCVTLVAYCETVCRTAVGQIVAEAAVSPAAVANSLAGVPVAKQQRAAVAAAAFNACLQAILTEEKSP